jgi:progesterone-induced-blocking factor 1
LKQTVALLDKDKDFFSKQVSELHNKLLYNEDKVIQLGAQLERVKDSREELYDKYVASR